MRIRASDRQRRDEPDASPGTAPSPRAARFCVAFPWIWLSTFLVALAVFSWNAPHPVPSSMLLIEGTTDRARTAVIMTDTGAGFSDQESARISFGSEEGGGVRELTVTAMGRLSDAALSGEVWINSIVLERSDGGTQTVLPGSEMQGVRKSGEHVARDNSLVLLAPGASFSLQAPFRRAKVNLGTSTYSGGAKVGVDGNVVEQADLYSQTGQPRAVAVEPAVRAGGFSLTVQLPQRPLKALRITTREAGGLPRIASAVLSGPDEADRRALDVKDWFGRDQVEARDLRFAPGRLTTAHATMLAVAAAYLATIVLALTYLIERLMVLRQEAALSQDRRRAAALRLGIGTTLLLFVYYLAWILGQWPGFLTIDSFEQIQEVLSGRYANWQPYGHTLFLAAFLQLADAPGFITVAHALGLSILAGAFFAFAYARKAPPPVVLVVAALLFLPHVAIYNLMVWRDVVFSLCVVAWFAILFACAFRAFYEQPAAPTGVTLVLLAVLLGLAGTVRHNGLVLVILIPVLLLLSGALPRRSTVKMAALSLGLYAASVGIVGHLLGAHRNTDYNLFRLALIVSPLIGITQSPSGYVSDDPARDRALMAKIWDVDQLVRTHSPLTVVPALYAVPRKAPLDGPEFAELSSRFTKLALMNPHLFVSERATLFLATLGARSWAWRNNLWDADPFAMAGRLSHASAIPTFAYLHPDPVAPALADLTKPVLARLAEPGPVPLFRAYAYPIAFTALPSLVLLLAVVLLWPWLPATALASLPMLALCAGLFVTGLSNDFRYVYYLYLFPIFALPAAAAEFVTRRKRQALARAAS